MSKEKEPKNKPQDNQENSLLQAAIKQSVLLPKETKVARETRNDEKGK